MGDDQIRRLWAWVTGSFITGAAVISLAYQLDEWLTLQQTSRVYVTHSQVRTAILNMESRINREKQLWTCLESRSVQECRLKYYQGAHDELLIERGK